MKKLLKMGLLVLLGIGGFASQGFAATTEPFQMSVIAYVKASCNVTSTSSMNFSGSVSEYTALSLTSVGTFTVNCSGQEYWIGVVSQNGGPVGKLIRATNDPSWIQYSFFQDSGFSTPWGGIGSGNEKHVLPGPPGGEHLIYGRTTGVNGTLSAGLFTDILNITLQF